MFWTCPTPTLKHPPLKANQAGCFHDGSATFERISALFSSVSLQLLFHIQRCVGVVRVLQIPSNNTCLPLDSCRVSLFHPVLLQYLTWPPASFSQPGWRVGGSPFNDCDICVGLIELSQLSFSL